MRTQDGSGLTVTVAKYLTPNGTDINNGISPDIEVKMNSIPIKPKEVGTKRDKQYKVGERELIRIINKTKLGNQFDPNSTNLLKVFEKKENNTIYSFI